MHAVWSAAGMSVCLSVCLWRSVLRRSGQLKVVPSCTRRALPIHFFRHFCCRMCNNHKAQRKAEPPKFPWPWQCGHVPKTDHGYSRRGFWRFGSAAIPYVVRSTIGLKRQLRFNCLTSVPSRQRRDRCKTVRSVCKCRLVSDRVGADFALGNWAFCVVEKGAGGDVILRRELVQEVFSGKFF